MFYFRFTPHVSSMKSRNEHWKAYTLEKIELNKFNAYIGFEYTKIEEGLIEGELVFKEQHQQQNGFLHGGMTATMCDMVSGFASYSLVEQGQLVFTVEAKVSYYNPGISDHFYARGWVVKAGKHFHFCESIVFYIKDGKEVIVAKGSTTMAVVTK